MPPLGRNAAGRSSAGDAILRSRLFPGPRNGVTLGRVLHERNRLASGRSLLIARRYCFPLLLVVALVSVGLAARGSRASSPGVGRYTLGRQTVGSGDGPYVGGVPAVAGIAPLAAASVGLRGRDGRIGPVPQPPGPGAVMLPPGVPAAAPDEPGHDQRFCDVAGSLLRGGLECSALGTPPPHR
jgi:hypothetical protein